MVLWLASHKQARRDKLALVLLVTDDDEVQQAIDAVEQAEPTIVLEPMLGLVTVALMVSASALSGAYLLTELLDRVHLPLHERLGLLTQVKSDL
jgi:hypothetical protein